MNGYNQILAMVSEWQNEAAPPGAAPDWKAILDHLAYLERVKFQPFIPTLYSSSHPASFMDRLHAWINNPGLEEEDRRDLFRFANQIAFFSFDDFVSLFRSAFAGPITRWCIDQAGVRLSEPDWQAKLWRERKEKTWFCPVTDSLLISVFHHVNEITGKDRRPAFRELKHFGDGQVDPEKNRIIRHIRHKGYERLVLLEDFVGTGDQTFAAVEWAVDRLGLPVLFCPMIIGPEGAERYRSYEADICRREGSPGRFAFAPIFCLDPDCFVWNRDAPASDLFQRISALAERMHGGLQSFALGCPEGHLGYRNENSRLAGATVVNFSNTPNNALPVIWHDAEGHWKSLFPRVVRQPL